MLYVYFGNINRLTCPRQFVYDIDAFFDGYVEPSWIDDWASRVLLEIDKSEFISPKVMSSPVFGIVPSSWISGGTKQLIMMKHVKGVVFDGDNFGDNCWRLLLELSMQMDLAISLSYYPIFEWLSGVSVTAINTGELLSDSKSFTMYHLHCKDKNSFVDFGSVEWGISIDSKALLPDEIDF